MLALTRVFDPLDAESKHKAEPYKPVEDCRQGSSTLLTESANASRIL